jgi:hypothetical protein
MMGRKASHRTNARLVAALPERLGSEDVIMSGPFQFPGRKGSAVARISARKEDLPAEKSGEQESRSVELGEYTVTFDSIPAGFQMGPEVFKGLPDDACQCPHWGILLKGEYRVPFTDGRTETVRAGEVYYLPPGHRFEVVVDAEGIEFSPTDQLRQTYEVVGRNMQG